MENPTDNIRIPGRRELPEAETWDLTPLFASPEDWEAAFQTLEAAAAPVLTMQGKLDSSEAVAALFEAETALDRLLERLYTFAHLRHDEDTADDDGQVREARIRARYAEIAAQCAWITPELLSHSAEELEQWMQSDALKPYQRAMTKILRSKPHVLGASEETLLAMGAEVLSASEQTYGMLTNADMTFPDIPGADGADVPLTEGSYPLYLEHRNRPLRRRAFETLLGGYAKWKNTIASTLSSAVKHHVFMAQARNFPSALDAALFDDQIPPAVYNGLIDAVHTALPSFHRYLDIRRRALKLDDLDMYDLYVPLADGVAAAVPPAQAREWITAACAPLGADYSHTLQTAFDQRWIDWPENKGKRSGAYSSGCYDSPPYLLLNYHSRLNDAFTLAHELGHSLHTWLANHAQPHRTASYPIFLAEIASTVNELLLTRHLLAEAKEPALRLYLLNHLADSFKSTLYRQTMFAEFERDIHTFDEEGRPLTADFLGTHYYDVNKTYYGPGLDAHPLITWEWCRIPHFYYNFYVYKYATSFCAALVFSRRIARGEGVGAYLDLLRSGGSRDPLDAIAAAGVDLRRPEIFAEAFAGLDTALDDLEGAL